MGYCNICTYGLYAGTTDCIGVHNGEDAIYIQDGKIKKRRMIEDYYPQCCMQWYTMKCMAQILKKVLYLWLAEM